MAENYRDYFKIDPEFFPAVNANVISEHPDIWKKFYPHATFVEMLDKLINVVNRRNKVSLWIEGAYGTGKSHAVITAKKLLDAPEVDVKEYFAKYPERLSNDLFKRFMSIKNGAPVLTVHRYGSSDINSDAEFLFAVQESIAEALEERGFSSNGGGALKTAAIRWLEDSANHAYFNTLMLENYRSIFKGDDVDKLIEKLRTYEGAALSELMSNILHVAGERRIRALTLDKKEVSEWIRLVIKENGLRAIVFFWDEMKEFFKNNMRRLTTFQTMVELSESDECSFYLIPVTHDVSNIFPPNDKEWTKIKGRFYTPFCVIRLPENVAFQLMGAAMEKTEDKFLLDEWDETVEELYGATEQSRELVKQKAGITDDELKKILPLHPYAALLLKFLASEFDSDARSMFDFIKSDNGDEIEGFQWYIDHFGPLDDERLLTVDMLWDFFYEKGRSFLSREVRRVLDTYNRVSRDINTEEKRVLKTILLMQAVFEAQNSDVRFLAACEKNLEYAFEGTDFDEGQATRIAGALERKNIIYRKPGSKDFAAMLNAEPEEVERRKQELRDSTRTASLIDEAQLKGILALKDADALRFDTYAVTSDTLKKTANDLRGMDAGNRLRIVIGFARDGVEADAIGKEMQALAKDSSYDLIFVDAGEKFFGDDRFDEYIDSKANYQHWLKKDSNQAGQYNNNINDILKKWRNSILAGEFILYSFDNRIGERVTIDKLKDRLHEINRHRYPMSLESFATNATNTMWFSNQLGNGAALGSGAQKPLGQFSCAPKDAGFAWSTQKYWEARPNETISKIKLHVEELIAKAFSANDRISIAEIYDNLCAAPYGFMPCNQTAFFMGLLLREYANGDFSYADGTETDPLDIDKLKSMIEEIIKQRMNNGGSKYKDKYIVKETAEIKAFKTASSTIFGGKVDRAKMEQVRDMIIQPGMKKLPFPLWFLKYAKNDVTFKTSAKEVDELIDLYVSFANSGRAGISPSEIATRIGEKCIAKPDLASDVQSLMSSENSRAGMAAYLKLYKGGILPELAAKVSDGGKYLTAIEKRLKVDAARWLWYPETIDGQIDVLILEYEIIKASNEILAQQSSDYDECIVEWCGVAKTISISYLYAEKYWNELSDFMRLLYEIKKSGRLDEKKKEDFLKQLQLHGQDFNTFRSNQVGVFKAACAFDLKGLDDIAVQDILKKKLQADELFTSEKSTYQQRVTTAVTAWKNEREGNKLLEYWKNATKTKTPKAWSKKYRTPVLCLVDDVADEDSARRCFNLINAAEKGNVSEADVKKAMAFLETHAKLFEYMEDEDTREAAFRKKIISSFDECLPDVEAVRDELENEYEPYDWYGNNAVRKLIHDMAEHAYNSGINEDAMRIIESMDAPKVKEYLKSLIRNNMAVGIEILKEGK